MCGLFFTTMYWDPLLHQSLTHELRMKTGQRGILLGGWAAMSAAVLEGEEDSELLAYCKDSFSQLAMCIVVGSKKRWPRDVSPNFFWINRPFNDDLLKRSSLLPQNPPGVFRIFTKNPLRIAGICRNQKAPAPLTWDILSVFFWGTSIKNLVGRTRCYLWTQRRMVLYFHGAK